jgi:hypothetical protein
MILQAPGCRSIGIEFENGAPAPLTAKPAPLYCIINTVRPDPRGRSIICATPPVRGKAWEYGSGSLL